MACSVEQFSLQPHHVQKWHCHVAKPTCFKLLSASKPLESPDLLHRLGTLADLIQTFTLKSDDLRPDMAHIFLGFWKWRVPESIFSLDCQTVFFDHPAVGDLFVEPLHDFFPLPHLPFRLITSDRWLGPGLPIEKSAAFWCSLSWILPKSNSGCNGPMVFTCTIAVLGLFWDISRSHLNRALICFPFYDWYNVSEIFLQANQISPTSDTQTL